MLMRLGQFDKPIPDFTMKWGVSKSMNILNVTEIEHRQETIGLQSM